VVSWKLVRLISEAVYCMASRGEKRQTMTAPVIRQDL